MINSIVDCLIKDDEYFYMDLEKWSMISDIKIERNDIFNFIFKNKKYYVKVLDILNEEAVLEEI
jgi:tRNA A58 N-methylase Trm61